MNTQFSHPATKLTQEKPLVYTAFSKHNFYARMHISKYVLDQGGVPLNPFMLFDYFLTDSVPRDSVRSANNVVVMRSDEVWAFGPISDGVFAELLLAHKRGKRIRLFTLRSKTHIEETFEAEMEEGMEAHASEAQKLIDSQRALFP